MARKFNDNQPNRGKSPNSYNQPPKNNKIQKNPKKDNQPQQNNFPKPQHAANPVNSTKPQFPQPPVQNPVPNKPLTEAGKNNLAKLASINQLMGVAATSAPKVAKPTQLMGVVATSASKTAKPTQTAQPVSSKATVRKPNPQQISQALESLKGLEKLLDSYDELEMDQRSNLKSLLEFLQQKKINSEQKENQKEKEDKTTQ